MKGIWATIFFLLTLSLYAQEIGIDESKLGGFLPLDAVVKDEAGRTFPLGDFVHRPTVIVFVYYRCPGICSPLLSDVADLLNATDLDPGNDFTVLTISFDPTDTPEVARQKRQNYQGLLTRNVREDAWRFLTADEDSIRRLTDAAGFRYMKDGKDFRHARALFFISKDGLLVRQLAGKSFLPFDLKMAVTEAEKGEVGSPLRRVLLLCFSYDPEGRKYVANVTRIAGVITVLFVATVFFILIRRRKRPAEEVQKR